ncbi:MAG: FapA family protein [Spirochaetia bacterium]|nr:FapA family protein [Spirochaetia bacterium]
MAEQQTNSAFRSIVAIHYSDDRLEGYLQFLVPSRANVTAGDIMDMINMEDIKYGVDQSAIEKAIIAYKENPEGNVKKNFLVVKGLRMVPGTEGRIEYYINEAPPVTIDENGKADFRNIEKFKTVEKDRLLAKVIRMKKGVDGIDIFGNSIKTNEVHDVKIKTGQNVTVNEQTGEVRSSVTGVYQKIRNVISVNPTLEIKGDVGLETGNLNYEGVIKINGNVERGAEVQATGDIFINGLIESGKISTTGSLHVKGGINTKHDGLIHVKDYLNATYIENSNIQSEGNLAVVSSIIGSGIITSGNVRTIKEGGKIVGGEITVLESIYTDNLGNTNETPTVITIGTHYYIDMEFRKSLEIIQELEEKLRSSIERINEIKVYIQRMQGKVSPEKKANFKHEFDMYKNIETSYQQEKEKLEKLKNHRFAANDPFISVKDTVFPGVTVHYFGFTEKIYTMYRHCSLRFSKSEGRMIVETYKEFPENQ